MDHPVRDRIPVFVASLGPKNVEMSVEVAEGWIPLHFWPERAGDVWGDAIAAGAAKRDRAPRDRRRRQPRHHRRLRAAPRAGPPDERVAAFDEAGVTVLNVSPVGPNALADLEKVRSWLD